MDAHPLAPSAAFRAELTRHTLAPEHRVSHPLRAANASRQRGDGVEFHQFRPYLRGDDLRRVDWRLYARSDRLYVRESEQESRLTVCLLIDTTASMSMRNQAGISRLDVAVRMAAGLAWLAMVRQHEIALLTITDGTPVFVRPNTGTAQFHRLLAALGELRAQGTWPGRRRLHKLTESLPQRSLVIAMSDWFEQEREQTRSVRDLLQHAHALTSIQLLTPDELTFRERGQLELIDVESGQRQLVDARGFRDQYLANLDRLLDAVRAEHVALGARFVRATTDMDVVSIARAALDNDIGPNQRLLAGVHRS